MERKKVYYTIEKSINENVWILWKNTEREKGCSCRRIFTGGTKKECKEYLKAYKNVSKNLDEFYNSIKVSDKE